MYKKLTGEVFTILRSRGFTIIKAIMIPFLILTGIGFAIGFFQGVNLQTSTNGIMFPLMLSIYFIICIPIGVIMAMMMYRGSSGNDNNFRELCSFTSTIKSGNIWRFITNTVLLILIIAVLWVALTFIASILLGLFGGSSKYITIIMFACLFAIFFVYCRLLIVLPASAIGDKISFKEALRLTKDYNFLSIYMLAILPILFGILFNLLMYAIGIILMGISTELLIVTALIAIFVNVIMGVITSLFVNICISRLYKFVIQKDNEKKESNSQYINDELNN
ncbi:hypothetical protein ACOL3H_06605 [Aliarcobacter butzleri]